jgi:putative peptide zinc metalloprotease protein
MEAIIDSSRVLIINKNCSWKKFDKKNYLICIDDGEKNSKLIISKEVVQLLSLIDGTNTLENVNTIYNEKSQHKLSNETIVKIFQENLNGYGIFEDDNDLRIKVKNKYIWLKITIFNKSIVKGISRYLAPAFGEKVFYPLLFLSIFITIIPFFYTGIINVYNSVDGDLFVNFIIINLLTLVFHEFGHSSACVRFGGDAGKIGFGFYIMSPVLFADVSDAWRLHKKERLIVDLGGVYMQLIITAMFSIYFLMTNDIRIVSLNTLILIGILFNLNPFLRFDGYWALCDYTNVTNLRDRAAKASGKFYGWLVGLNKNFHPTKKDIFFILYNNFSMLLIINLILFMVIKQNNSFIYFPKNLYLFIHEIVIKLPSDFNWYKKNIVALLPFATLYIILGISLYTGLQQHLKKRYEKKI